jgi:hypothetical protein
MLACMRTLSRLGSASLVLATLSVTLAVTSTPAHANHDPVDVCNQERAGRGGAFAEVDRANLAANGASGIVYLLQNHEGYFCAITIKTSNVGTYTPTSVRIQRRGGTLFTNGGEHTHYAGPEYAYGKVVGVWWGGAVADDSGLPGHFDSYLSNCEHGDCTDPGRGALIANQAYYEYYNEARRFENPLGSNCNYFSGALGVGLTSGCPGSFRWEEWCADYAKYVWKEAQVGAKDLDELTPAALSFRTYGQNHGTWSTSQSSLKFGDVVVYSRPGGGHVGIVVDPNGSSSWILSGNSGPDDADRVYRHQVNSLPGLVYLGSTRPAY